MLRLNFSDNRKLSYHSLLELIDCLKVKKNINFLIDFHTDFHTESKNLNIEYNFHKYCTSTENFSCVNEKSMLIINYCLAKIERLFNQMRNDMKSVRKFKTQMSS